jgi:hypothetical protein
MASTDHSSPTAASRVQLSLDLARVVWEMTQAQSLKSFELFFTVSSIKSEFVEVAPATPLGHLLVAIIVQGNGIRLTLKVHSDIEPMREVSAQVCGLPVLEMNETRVRDCLREYLNILAGAIQSELSKVDIESRLSIPISTRGFDELFFGKPSTAIQYQNAWRLTWNDRHSAIMTAFIEFIDLDAIKALLNYDPNAPVEDLFELLSKEG